MNKVLIGVVAAILLAGIGFGVLQLTSIIGTQDKLQETLSDSRIQSCQSTKQNLCAMGSEISEDSYPDNCFESGEHILDNPYQCS